MITTAFSAANAARPRKDGKIVRKVRIDGQDREFLWDPKVPFDDRAKAKVVELFRRSDLKSAKNYAVSAGLNPDEILKSYNPGPYKYFDKLGRRVEPDPFVKAVTQLDNGRVGLPVGLNTVKRAPYNPNAPVQSTEVIDYLKDTVAKRLGEKVPLTAKRGDPLQIIMRGYDEKFKNDPKWAVNRPVFKEQVLKMLGPGYGSDIASGLSGIATNYRNNGKWQRDLEDERADVSRLQKTAGLAGERAKQTFREGQVIRMLAENGMIPAHYVKYAAPYERSAKIGSGTVDKASQLAQEADLNVQLRDMSGLEWAISGLMNPVSTINSALLGMTPRQAMANMAAGQKFAAGAADLLGGLALGNAAGGAIGALFKTGGAVGMGEMGVGRALGQAAARELAVGAGPMAAQFAVTANKRGLEEALREVNPLSPLTDPSADWADKTLGAANAAMLGLGAYHGAKNFGPVLRARVEGLIPGLKGMGLSDSALMRAEMLHKEFKNQFREQVPVIGTPYGKSELSNSKASYLVENFIKSEVAEKRAQLERTVGPEEAAKVSDAKIAEKVLSGALSAYRGRVNPIFKSNQHDKEAQAANDLAMASLLGGNEHAAKAYSEMAQKLQRKADMAGRQPIPAAIQELSTALANTTVKPLPRSKTFVPVPQPKPFVVSDTAAQEPVNPALAAAGQRPLEPVNPVVQLDRTPVPAPSPEGYAKTGWNEAVGKTIDQSLADIREEGAKLPQYKKTTALPPEQALMRTFKGFKATKTDDGYELVHNKTGKKILIRDVKRIDANGVELKPGEFIGGEARVLEVDGQPMSLEGVIALAQGGRRTTVYHEAFHVMEKMGLLRRDEWEHLHKNYGEGKSGSPVENIADAYESWLAGRGTDDRVFTKIKRFFGDVRDFLFNHTEWKKSKVFRDMESGKVWSRETGKPGERGMPKILAAEPVPASKQSHSIQRREYLRLKREAEEADAKHRAAIEHARRTGIVPDKMPDISDAILRKINPVKEHEALAKEAAQVLNYERYADDTVDSIFTNGKDRFAYIFDNDGRFVDSISLNELIDILRGKKSVDGSISIHTTPEKAKRSVLLYKTREASSAEAKYWREAIDANRAYSDARSEEAAKRFAKVIYEYIDPHEDHAEEAKEIARKAAMHAVTDGMVYKDKSLSKWDRARKALIAHLRHADEEYEQALNDLSNRYGTSAKGASPEEYASIKEDAIYNAELKIDELRRPSTKPSNKDANVAHSVQTLSFSLRSRYPQVVRSIKQEKATGEQWLAMLSKSLKSDELEYSGIKRWLAGNAGKTLTKTQLLDWAAEHQMEMYVEDRKGPDVEGEWLNKYTKYGKKNYTERLYKPAFQSDEDGTPYGWTRSNPGGTLKHWADRSVMAHARFGEQVLPDGSKSLHLSEAQSDLHHIGSKHGYKGDNVPIEAYKELYDTVKGKLQLRLKNLNEDASNLRTANVYSSVSSELKKTLGIDLRKPLKQLTPQDMDGVLNLLDERLRKLRSEEDESLSTGNSQRYHELVNEVERVKRLSLDFDRLHRYVNSRQSLWELHRELTQLGSYINGKSDKLHPDAVKSLERLAGMEWSFNKIANLPYKGQKYAEMILRDMVAEAVFKNIGQVTWDSGAMQVKRWSGTDAADKLTHIYDKILVRHAKDLEKKYGLKYDTVDMGDGNTVHRLTIPEEATDKIKDEGLPAYSIQNRTTVKALPHDATEALIKSVYKGASIERDPEGYTVNTKAGRVRIVVADHIAPDETILLNDYGIRGVQPGLRVASSWRLSKGEKTLGVDGLITLARGAGRRELLHESFHNAVDFGLITNKEWSALMKRYGTEEKAAMAYEQWAARPKGNTVFQRLRQRAVDLLNAIAHRREIKLFREMKAGTIWEREAVGVENAKDHGVKYAVRASNLALAKHYGILTPDTEALWRVLVDADALNSRVNAITSSGGDLYAIGRDNADPDAITNDTPFDYVSGDDTYGRNLLNSVEWRRAMEDPRGTVSRMYFEEPSGKRHYNLTKSQADALAKKLKVKLTEHREVLSVFKDPTLVDDLDKLEKAVQSIPGLSTVKLFERNADGKIIGLIESMMEQRRDANDPTKALFKGLRRTIGQTIIDNLPEPVFEKVRGQMYEAVRRAVKEGKDAGAPFMFAKWDPVKQAPMKGPKTKSAAFYDRNIDESGSGDFGTAPALKGSEKTVAAINLTSACPMIQVGGDWCYADACYVAEMAKAGQTIPFYYRSMYTGEILQLSDESIRLLNSVGGLRLNGWGDTEYTSRHQLKDIFRDAESRGLKLKIISKQETIFKILQEYKNEGGNIDHIIVQPTVDPYYVRVDRMEKYTMASGVDPKAESKNTLAGLLGGGKIPEHLKGQEREDYIQAVRDMYREKGREIHVDENGDIWRKYGFTFEQAKELKQKYPDVNIHVRTVLATYEEIAKAALMGDTIQTWMHATIREPFYSDILGRVVTPEETANFKFHPAIFKDVNGDWHIYAAQKGHYAKGDLTDALVKAQRKLMDLADAGNLDAKKQAAAEKLRATVNEYNARLAAGAESEEAVLGLHDDRMVGQTIGVVKEYDGLEKYIKASFTPEEQEKIFSTLQRGVCCGAGFDADSCADCLGHCASRAKQVVSDGSPTGFVTPEELISANAERLSKRNTLWQIMGNDNARDVWVNEQVEANEKLLAQRLRAENKEREKQAEKLAVNLLIGEIGADKYASMKSKELKAALKGMMDKVYAENPDLEPVPIPKNKALRDAAEADWIAKGRPHLVGKPFVPLASAEPAPVRVAPKQSTEVSFSVQKRKASLAEAVKDPEFYDHIVSGQRTAPDKAPYLRQIIRAAGGLESGQFDVGGLPAENTKGRKNILVTLENTRKLFFGDTKEGQKEYELARLIVNRLPEPVIKDVSLLHAPVVEDGAYGAAYTHPAVNAIVIATKGSSKHPEEFANTLVHEFVHVAQQYIPERMMVKLVKEFRSDIERMASSNKLKAGEEYARIERAMEGKDRAMAAKAAFAEWLAGKVADGLVEKARAVQGGPLSKMVYALKRVMRVAARALLDAPSDKAVNEMIKSLSNPDVQWVRERSSLVAPLFKEEPFDARDCGEAFWRLKRGEVDTPDYETADDALLGALRDFLTDRKGSAPTDEELYAAYWSGLQSFGESMIPHGEQFAVDAFTSSLMNEFARTGKVDAAEALHRAELGIKKKGDVFGPTDMEAFRRFLEANGFKNLSPEEVRSAFFMSYAAAQARYASEGLNYGGFERLVRISHAGSDYSRPGLNLGARTDHSGQTIQQMLEESRKIGADEVFGKASSVLQPGSRETFTSTEQMAAARLIEDQRAEQIRYLRVALNLQEAMQSEALNPEKAKTPAERASIEAARDNIATEAMKYYNMYTAATVRAGTLLDALDKTGSEWGRMGRARQELYNNMLHDPRLAHWIAEARKSGIPYVEYFRRRIKEGGVVKLTPEEEAQVAVNTTATMGQSLKIQLEKAKIVIDECQSKIRKLQDQLEQLRKAGKAGEEGAKGQPEGETGKAGGRKKKAKEEGQAADVEPDDGTKHVYDLFEKFRKAYKEIEAKVNLVEDKMSKALDKMRTDPNGRAEYVEALKKHSLEMEQLTKWYKLLTAELQRGREFYIRMGNGKLAAFADALQRMDDDTYRSGELLFGKMRQKPGERAKKNGSNRSPNLEDGDPDTNAIADFTGTLRDIRKSFDSHIEEYSEANLLAEAMARLQNAIIDPKKREQIVRDMIRKEAERQNEKAKFATAKITEFDRPDRPFLMDAGEWEQLKANASTPEGKMALENAKKYAETEWQAMVKERDFLKQKEDRTPEEEDRLKSLQRRIKDALDERANEQADAIAEHGPKLADDIERGAYAKWLMQLAFDAETREALLKRKRKLELELDPDTEGRKLDRKPAPKPVERHQQIRAEIAMLDKIVSMHAELRKLANEIATGEYSAPSTKKPLPEVVQESVDRIAQQHHYHSLEKTYRELSKMRDVRRRTKAIEVALKLGHSGEPNAQDAYGMLLDALGYEQAKTSVPYSRSLQAEVEKLKTLETYAEKFIDTLKVTGFWEAARKIDRALIFTALGNRMQDFVFNGVKSIVENNWISQAIDKGLEHIVFPRAGGETSMLTFRGPDKALMLMKMNAKATMGAMREIAEFSKEMGNRMIHGRKTKFVEVPTENIESGEKYGVGTTINTADAFLVTNATLYHKAMHGLMSRLDAVVNLINATPGATDMTFVRGARNANLVSIVDSLTEEFKRVNPGVEPEKVAKFRQDIMDGKGDLGQRAHLVAEVEAAEQVFLGAGGPIETWFTAISDTAQLKRATVQTGLDKGELAVPKNFAGFLGFMSDVLLTEFPKIFIRITNYNTDFIPGSALLKAPFIVAKQNAKSKAFAHDMGYKSVKNIPSGIKWDPRAGWDAVSKKRIVQLLRRQMYGMAALYAAYLYSEKEKRGEAPPLCRYDEATGRWIFDTVNILERIPVAGKPLGATVGAVQNVPYVGNFISLDNLGGPMSLFCYGYAMMRADQDPAITTPEKAESARWKMFFDYCYSNPLLTSIAKLTALLTSNGGVGQAAKVYLGRAVIGTLVPGIVRGEASRRDMVGGIFTRKVEDWSDILASYIPGDGFLGLRGRNTLPITQAGKVMPSLNKEEQLIYRDCRYNPVGIRDASTDPESKAIGDRARAAYETIGAAFARLSMRSKDFQAAPNLPPKEDLAKGVPAGYVCKYNYLRERNSEAVDAAMACATMGLSDDAVRAIADYGLAIKNPLAVSHDKYSDAVPVPDEYAKAISLAVGKKVEGILSNPSVRRFIDANKHLNYTGWMQGQIDRAVRSALSELKGDLVYSVSRQVAGQLQAEASRAANAETQYIDKHLGPVMDYDKINNSIAVMVKGMVDRNNAKVKARLEQKRRTEDK